ncbi:hypothetical protein CR492_07675 [Methylocella silvestris]|uniref:Uncharacterized protein n=1 Tax=Methylocella silvestris TaxID=199596 RepID=A0A2J7TIG4_METSI|nr:hypothetical protein CR492_07675 [Methylocella silvestris]
MIDWLGPCSRRRRTWSGAPSLLEFCDARFPSQPVFGRLAQNRVMPLAGDCHHQWLLRKARNNPEAERVRDYAA